MKLDHFVLPVCEEFYDGGDQSYQVKCDTLIINRFPLSLEIFSLFSELKRIRFATVSLKKKYNVSEKPQQEENDNFKRSKNH